MTNKTELKQSLNKIGWEIRGEYPRERIIDHDKKAKDIRVYSDRLEISGENYTNCFYFNDVELYELEQNGHIDCVGLKANENVFIQFYNHTK